MNKNILRCEGITDLEKVIARADILEILKKYAPSLRKRNGKEFFGRCPFSFHEDRIPSFGIHVGEGSKKGVWNCGCGSGNIVRFMKNVTGVNDEAQIAKILESNQLEKGSFTNETVYQLESLISNWDQTNNDDVTKEVLPRMRQSKPPLVKYLIQKRKGYSTREALEVIRKFGLGVSIDYESNPVYNWIIVPVKSKQGKPIMWIAQHPISRRKYNGGRTTGLLFNINNAIKNNWVIVVESMWCAIRLNMWGYPAISPFGARMDDIQAKTIKKHWKTVYLCYDMYDKDSAGSRAQKKAIKLLTPQLKVKTVLLPKGKDPDKCTVSEMRAALHNSSRVGMIKNRWT